jgi:hypothetical protein
LVLFYIFNNILEKKEYFNNNNYYIIKNKKIKKIVNVYNLDKNDDGKIFGFGDYIRGCIAMLALCDDNNILFDVDYQYHPISKFLTKDNNEKYNQNYDNIPQNYNSDIKFNKNDLIKFINNINKYHKSIYFNYNNLFPYRNLTNIEKNILKSKFIPNNVLSSNIDKTLEKLNLVKNRYNVIHIRTGDNYLMDNKKIDKKKINNIISKLKKNINYNNKYLLLSDNNYLKKILSNKFSNFIFQINDILHLGEQKNFDNEPLKNTLTDFFLIAYSNNVISFSLHEHGTGFSEQCCKLYDIPYKNIKL